MTTKDKAEELALEMGQRGSLNYSHAICILNKIAAWKEEQMIEKAVKFIRDKNKNGGFLFDKNWEEDFVKTIKEK